MKEKCCVLGKDKGKMERRAGPFLLWGTEQTHRPHNPTTVVMLYLADSVTAGWHPPTLPPYCPHKPTPPTQPIEGNRKEQGLSLLVHPRNCQASTPPQLATDPFLPASLRHTPLCQCFAQNVWCLDGQKVGVAWELSYAVPKLAKIKPVKFVTIRPWKHTQVRKTVSKHYQKNVCMVSKYWPSLKPVFKLGWFAEVFLNTTYFQHW